MSTLGADIDLFAAIDRLKREKNAVILAHYYQEPDLQDAADFIGDSLELSRKAAQTKADIIVFCGVHFMAETAKILSPGKKVLIPDLNAGCSLADGCPADRFGAWLKKYPGHKVISYINCSAAVKAMSDLICTSSNAVAMVESYPQEQPIVFAPDQYLGAWVQRQTGRRLVLWPRPCQVHEIFSEKKILQLQVRHPGAKIIAHPECKETILRHAAFIGSTSKLLHFTQLDAAAAFIVVTEPGIIHQMQKASPQKTFLMAPGEAESCSCNSCPYMRLHTLEKLHECLRTEGPEVRVPEAIRVKALLPIQRMLDLSAKLAATPAQ